jgi:hypothetical protein
MAKSPDTSTPAATPAAAATAAAAATPAAATDPSSDVTRVLLDVFRKVNSQVKAPLELSKEAVCAVHKFRCIAAELATNRPFASPATAPPPPQVDV